MNLGVSLNCGFPTSSVESYFIDMGRADIQSVITMVGRSALLAAWYVKWNTLFLRPEALGIEIERAYRCGNNMHNISPELLHNPVLEAVREQNGTTLLSQVYPEGSPLHPSSPSGHGTIAGACATILKFFFNSHHELDIYKPTPDGSRLIKTGQRTTVEDELNKLASNIAIGRNWAGIHYHMDAIRGMKLGEKVAISCLQDIIHRYNDKISVTFNAFSGKLVTITNH